MWHTGNYSFHTGQRQLAILERSGTLVERCSVQKKDILKNWKMGQFPLDVIISVKTSQGKIPCRVERCQHLFTASGVTGENPQGLE